MRSLAFGDVHIHAVGRDDEAAPGLGVVIYGEAERTARGAFGYRTPDVTVQLVSFTSEQGRALRTSS